ncbi:hypothetical protein [Desulfomonile tiedjei]|uniref:Uncharacterized protein n=1 Tax=Desulfomonile tiedjei (strain ATCC 49306 / DSM 6799 / DCB-1) TaxID=706587 RepID=I4BZM7_DESTA|nr:hypothetical protein [Desulfomonile tiedjei]AFM22768.1 hypothetical protein Desti_0016 [Desulfomonile tiedjei DSM 6799]
MMIKSSTEDMQKVCAAFIVEDQEVDREQLIEKLEDCLDMAAAIQAIDEVRETADISDWDEFVKELDATE